MGAGVTRSTRTTQLYDRWSDEVSLDEVERISIGLQTDDGVSAMPPVPGILPHRGM
jgi:hypothetical protein